MLPSQARVSEVLSLVNSNQASQSFVVPGFPESYRTSHSSINYPSTSRLANASMADIEKHDYTVQGGSESDHGVKEIVAQRGGAVGEAADIYGDLATAEQYGYVERG